MIVAEAHARTGLLGNPSDGYGGRVIAMTLPQMSAQVTLRSSAVWEYRQSELLAATVTGLRNRRPALVQEPAALSFTTTIPRQVGLSGSTAIIIATLRALALRADHEWDPTELAQVALEVETDVLGWTAGPQDRVVVAHEGVLDMDFSSPWNPDGYERVDPTRLPPLFVVWPYRTGTPSSVVHTSVRDRWLAGEEAVVQTMDRFAQLAVEGRAAIDDGTATDRWPTLMNTAFELRKAIWTITPQEERMVAAGRHLGAGATLAGSGGAIVGSVPDRSLLGPLALCYADLDTEFLVINE